MSVFVGLDLSLTATGIAITDGSQEGARCYVVKSKGRLADALDLRNERLTSLDDEIRSIVPAGAVVAVETPAYNQTSGNHHDRSGLWWLVVSGLAPYHRIVEVSTTQVKKYATGKGNAGKDEVMIAAAKRYPEFDITDNNSADAVVIAAFASRAFGYPIEESLPQANLAALEKFTVSR
nr:MAG TPA: RuvC [Caudoviricetes sp.]